MNSSEPACRECRGNPAIYSCEHATRSKPAPLWAPIYISPVTQPYTEPRPAQTDSRELVCSACQTDSSWTLSCIHTWAPNVEPRPEHENDIICGDPAGQRLNEQSRRSALALLGGPRQRVVERTPEEWAEFARRISLRWLDTKDHRGPVPRRDGDTACCPPLGAEERAKLRELGFSLSGEPARKRREKPLTPNLADPGDSEDSGSKPDWFARIIHPRWKLHAAKASDPHPRVSERMSARIREEFRTWTRAVRAVYASGARLQQPGVRFRFPTDAGWPKFAPSALSEVAAPGVVFSPRARWELDRALDRISARAAWHNEKLWNSILAKYKMTDEYGRYAGSHEGWALRVAAKRADKLLAIEAARRRAEARAVAYAFKRSATERALDELELAVRRVAWIDPRTERDEYLATLPQRIAVEFAKREPKAYIWLAEADEAGATEIPAYVVKVIRRNPLVEYPRSRATDLPAVLRGQRGDGQRLIATLAERRYGFQAARKRLRKTAT